MPFSGQGGVEAVANAQGNPHAMGLKVEERGSIDFVRDIQPMLDRHCVSCHSDGKPAAFLNLAGEKTRYYSKSYENLMQLEEPSSAWWGRKKYVDEREAMAIKSYLIAKVYGQQLKAERILQGDRPHPSKQLFLRFGQKPDLLSLPEKQLLALWIDLGACFKGAPGAPPAQAPLMVAPLTVARTDSKLVASIAPAKKDKRVL